MILSAIMQQQQSTFRTEEGYFVWGVKTASAHSAVSARAGEDFHRQSERYGGIISRSSLSVSACVNRQSQGGEFKARVVCQSSDNFDSDTSRSEAYVRVPTRPNPLNYTHDKRARCIGVKFNNEGHWTDPVADDSPCRGLVFMNCRKNQPPKFPISTRPLMELFCCVLQKFPRC